MQSATGQHGRDDGYSSSKGQTWDGNMKAAVQISMCFLFLNPAETFPRAL